MGLGWLWPSRPLKMRVPFFTHLTGGESDVHVARAGAPGGEEGKVSPRKAQAQGEGKVVPKVPARGGVWADQTANTLLKQSRNLFIQQTSSQLIACVGVTNKQCSRLLMES